jgi:3-hydroxyisobutyrate dehydrogenase-like beta-hydroxyacid dehydrogenase
MSDVTILGTGLMGSGVARALLSAGYDVTVWNRSPQKAEGLARYGAKLAPTAAAAIAASPISISVLIGYDVVAEVLSTASAELVGRDFVNFTSGSPEEAVRLDARLSDRGVNYLDGALLCFPSDIGGPGRIKYSGSGLAWARNETLLGKLGDVEYLGDDVRLANVMDGVILAYYLPLLGAAMEAAAFGAAHGVPIPTVMNELRSLELLTRKFLVDSEPLMVAGDHRTDEATVEIYRAGIQGVVQTMEEAGLKSYMMQAADDYLALADEAGHKDSAFSVVFEDHLATRKG